MKMRCITILFSLCMLLSGCQAIARNYGGNVTVTLEPGVKLEEITWKDNSLWYLTRPMRDGEEPETHIFKESSNTGVLEGTVTIIERAKDPSPEPSVELVTEEESVTAIEQPR